MMSQFEALLKNLGANPQQVFNDTVQVTLANGHPRVKPLSAEMLKELDLQKMMAFYRDRFGDAGDFTFLFVGNVNVDTLKPLVEQWVASLPTKGRKETFRDVGPRHFTGQIDKTVKKGMAPQANTLVILAGDTPWTRAEAHAIESLGDLLEMRLNERLRENLGGTYSVGVNAGMSRRPKEEWNVMVQFGSAPDKAEMMYKAVLAEFDSLRRVPPTASEIDRVREQQRRAQESAKTQNGWWMSALQSRLEYGDPFATINERDALIASLSAEKLHAAAKKFLDETNRARFVLLPESGPMKQ
jgi:zinc protease